MEHHYIEEHNIPDRYLQGTLTAAERIGFEEHLIDCAECLERLEITEDFRGALRTVAAEDAATPRIHPRVSRSWMASANWRQAALLAAATLVLVALPAGLLIREARQSRRELAQASLTAADWQRRYEDSQRAVQAREQELSRQRLEFEAQRQQGRGRAVEDGSRQARLEPNNAPIFALNTVRSAFPGQSAPANRITVPRTARWIVLKMETEPDPDLQSYRATLLTSAQQPICRASDLVAVKGVLAISCDASLVTAGDYRLSLEGLNRQGRYLPASAYSLQVIRP